MMKPMTHRERMIGLIRGEEIDRVPFAQYHNIAGKDEDIWAHLGQDSMGVLEWMPAYRIETPNCRIEQEPIRERGLNGWRDTLHTPVGTLTQRRLLIPQLDGPMGYAEHYVKTLDDYPVLLAYLKDYRVVEDISAIEAFHHRMGAQGLPHVSIPRTPYQALWIEWVKLDDLILHMQDNPDMLMEVMNQLGDILLQTLHVTAGAAGKAEFYHVTMGDNLHAPVIGTTLFREWCVPYYNQISDVLDEAGIPFLVHMDGDLKPLWEDIDACRHRGFDSLSPPPDNDTRVAEAIARWPDKMVWVNFPSSVHLQEAEDIYRTAMELLTEGGHSGRFWIQISEDVPPGRWKHSFPAILQAIEDFGKP